MSNVFFTSDLHLNHANCAKWRGFKTVEEQNETIIRNWNSTVTKRDVVHVVGDVLFGKNIELLRELKGHKILYLGNHDNLNIYKYLSIFKKVTSTGGIRKKFLISHFPIHPGSVEHYDLVNVHGHIHGVGKNIKDIILEPSNKFFNVNVEFHNYFPVPIEDIEKKMFKK